MASRSCIYEFEYEGPDGRLTYAVFRRCLSENKIAVVHGAADAFVLAPELRCGANEPTIASLRRLLSPRGMQSLFGDLRRHTCPVYRFDDAGSSTSAGDSCGGMDGLGCAEQATLQDAVDAWMGAGKQLPGASGEGRSLRWYVKDWHFQLAVEEELLRVSRMSVADESSPSVMLGGKGTQHHDASHAPGEPLDNHPAVYRIPSFLGPDLVHGYFLHCRARRQSSASEFGNNSADTAAAATSHSVPLFFGTGLTDYRFAYVGAKGTWTPLHHDVFGTFSWSLNVAGKKLWYFLEPESQCWAEENFRRGLPLPPDIRVMSRVSLVSLVQDVGDLVFVPSGWFHQVHNVEGEVLPPCDAFHCSSSPPSTAPQPLVVSINHNWIGPDQLRRMTTVFVDDVTALLQMIGSDRNSFEPLEWRDLLERMLLGGGAWNFSIMDNFLSYCAVQVTQFAEAGCGDLKSETVPKHGWLLTQRDCAGLQYSEVVTGAQEMALRDKWTNAVADCVDMVTRCKRIAFASSAPATNPSL